MTTTNSTPLFLLREDVDLEDFEIISERVKGKPTQYYIEGVFLQADTTNKNGRVYPADVLHPAVDKYVQERVLRNRAVGEMGHPDSPVINLERVSHKVTKLTFEGRNVLGRAKILQSLPMGQIATSLLDEGVQLGVSSRGLGSLKSVGKAQVVQPDYILHSIDIVFDPSVPDAFVTGLMEDQQWVYRFGSWVPILRDKAEKKLDNLGSQKYSEVAISLFEEFLDEVVKNSSF